LPTWDKAGPEYFSKNTVPSDAPVYPVSDEVNSKVSFWMRGDSARLDADAIVNAANSGLWAGGGICGVIHSAAGPELEDECQQYSPTDTGKAALTKGYRLPARYVIHAVGPMGEDKELLTSAYESTLAYMDGDKIKSIGFCCISTGIFGYPIVKATHVALETVRKWLDDPANLAKTDRIVFVVFEPRDVEVYYRLAPIYFPMTGVAPGPPPPKTDGRDEDQPAKPVKPGKTEAPVKPPPIAPGNPADAAEEKPAAVPAGETVPDGAAPGEEKKKTPEDGTKTPEDKGKPNDEAKPDP
jgi:O-acetyl-ADP-ribose deacetylase (regulator of RNase III)